MQCDYEDDDAASDCPIYRWCPNKFQKIACVAVGGGGGVVDADDHYQNLQKCLLECGFQRHLERRRPPRFLRHYETAAAAKILCYASTHHID